MRRLACRRPSYEDYRYLSIVKSFLGREVHRAGSLFDFRLILFSRLNIAFYFDSGLARTRLAFLSFGTFDSGVGIFRYSETKLNNI